MKKYITIIIGLLLVVLPLSVLALTTTHRDGKRLVQEAKELYAQGQKELCREIADQYADCIKMSRCDRFDELSNFYSYEFGYDPITDQDCLLRQEGVDTQDEV